MSNMSWNAIRSIVPQQAVEVTTQATSKVVEKAKSIGNAIKDVMPATSGRVNNLEQNAALAISALRLEVDQLRAQIGLERQPIVADEVVTNAAQLLALWNNKLPQTPAQEAPRVVVEPVQQPVVQQTPVVEAPAQAQPQMDVGIPISQPSDWHQAAGK